MCSICGGTRWDSISQYIWQASEDRGRDDSGIAKSHSGLWIGNRRATPTTEVEKPLERQPVGEDPKIVFNGIISNDKELGSIEGEADTSVLPRVLSFTSLSDFRDSIQDKLIGSYAMAVLFEGVIWLACNYKPIWIAEEDGQVYFSSLKSHFPKYVNPHRMDPYSVRLLTLEHYSFEIERIQHNKAVVICSAGLDSTTVASVACKVHGNANVTLLHFDYGCRATGREIDSIGKIADFLGCGLEIVPMASFGGSSLLKDSTAPITEGIKGAEYAHEWVPARNLMMLSHAVAFAEAKQYGHIYLGTNLEEAGAYPDNEEQFILDFNNLLYGAVQNGIKIEIHTPLGGLMKHEIVKLGISIDTPYHLTWSCYHGEDIHCGKCGPCFMRRTAFRRNGIEDPVPYKNS